MKTMKKWAVCAAVGLGACLGAGQASAGIVTFDDVPLPDGMQLQYAAPGGAFTSGGFDFALQVSIAGYVTNGQLCSPSCPVNGSTIVLSPYGRSALVMTRSGGGSFSLSGFDGTGAFNFNESNFAALMPTHIDVLGYTAAGAEVAQSFAIDGTVQSGPLPFTSYVFDASFTDLVSVSFSSHGSLAPDVYNGFAIDNIAASASDGAVPEPATLALLGAGMLGCAAARRRAAGKRNE